MRTLTIAHDGTFSTVWTPPMRDEYRLEVRVPVERLPDGFNLRYERHIGYVRW